ncbi:hypothetical protein Tco_0928902 [Tanacetum coccineum]
MFDPPSEEDDIWKLPHQQHILNWRYFHSRSVHCLTVEASHIYMLTKVKYPLPPRVYKAMLEKKLLGDRKDELAIVLQKAKQIQDFGPTSSTHAYSEYKVGSTGSKGQKDPFHISLRSFNHGWTKRLLEKVVNGNEISEYEENTNEEFDNQDTPYALWNEQDHAEQSSSHECHASDPPEAAYYNKSDDPDEEYIARRLQIAKKVNFDLEFSIWLEENFLDPKNIDQDTRNALSKQKDICNKINRKDRTIENDENVFDSFSHLYENVFG